jgi:hypothetical protein
MLPVRYARQPCNIISIEGRPGCFAHLFFWVAGLLCLAQMSIAAGHATVACWLMPLLTLRVVNTISSSLLSGMIWPRPMKRWYRKKFHHYGRQVHRMPEMQCPVCGVVVTEIVMKVPPGRSLLRCAECGVHFVIGCAAPVLSFVKSSIGPIIFPTAKLGGNRLATWSPRGFPATRSITH